MRRCIFLSSLLFISICVSAIDTYNDVFRPSSLVGKTIIIPTYNGGDERLNFVYNESVLQSRKFTYQNYSSTTVLGKPIRIVDYKIINEGKKSEVLCLVAEADGAKVVLAFPMFIEYSDFTGSVIAQLFYGAPLARTRSSARYTIDHINLRYYLEEDIQKFKTIFLGQSVYLGGTDGILSNKQYKFSGFSFLPFNKKFSDDEKLFIVSSYSHFYQEKDNNLDVLYGIFDGHKRAYIQIKENYIEPLNENSISFSGLKNIVFDELSYRQTFKPLLSQSCLDSLIRMIGKEWFFPSRKFSKNVLISKMQDFTKYDEVSYSQISGHYIVLDSLEQLKTTDLKGNILYDYYLTGKGSECGVFEYYIAIPLDNNILKDAIDGTKYRKQVALEEQKREKANRERLARLEKEEKEYKKSLIKKYGQSNARLIQNGEVSIGFTKAMCKEAWGEPEYINNTISSFGKWEQWVYGLGTYLYFSGNKLVVIQN